MKAIILNAGSGSRMGAMTSAAPKCLTLLATGETILARQLGQIAAAGIREVIMTTGLYDGIIRSFCLSLGLALDFSFVANQDYDQTNYIYSLYLASALLDGDLLLLHGDVVCADEVVAGILGAPESHMAVAGDLALSPKDFKAVIADGLVKKIGVEFMGSDAVMAQPLYRLAYRDWLIWQESIARFCEAGKTSCYAEDAFNENPFRLLPYDVSGFLCAEIDTLEDLAWVNERLMKEDRI